ncbi:MAG: Smr/MutS family protein [Bacteroidota bacterium]|nr:Smr/MutS family protein [Bacteroidota bacterium]
MLYPSNFEFKIGFDKIKELLSEKCTSVLGRQYVEKIRFSTDSKLIAKLIGQTHEFAQFITEGENFPNSNFIDVNQHLEHAKIIGSVLPEDAFRDLKLSLQTINQCVLFINKRKNAPLLQELTVSVVVDVNLIKQINKVIDDNGKIRDQASSELFNIRKELYAEQGALRKKLEQTLKKHQESGEAPEDLSLTVRNGRLVIPVFAENKRKIKGLIYDESNTGQTVFMEPIEAFDANNRIKELENEEKRELIRILAELTDKLRLNLSELKNAYRFLGMIDFIRAKAILSLLIKAEIPRISDSSVFHWTEVYHPLLYINLKQQNKSIVSMSLELNESQKMLVVSGPNAGGKSVMLKTVGLLQYMFQCGFPIPNGEKCAFSVFKNICIDIGDEQSIDNDLSTYSSHLNNMKEMAKVAGKDTLILIDEFGTGTDPQYGGALAESILDDFVKSGAYGVVNTHYSNLKYFAQNTSGVVNGAMLFDYETLTPLYQLSVGKPGNSFALEIAQKIGLSPLIIENAKTKIGKEQLKVDDLVKELQLEKQSFTKKNIEIDKQRRNLEIITKQYEELKAHIESSKSKAIADAKVEAKKIVTEAKYETTRTLKNLKDAKNLEDARKQNSKGKMSQLEKNLGIANIKNEEPDSVEIGTDSTELKVGQKVYFKGQEGIFTLLSIKGNEVELLAGELKINTKINRIVRAPSGHNDKKSISVKLKGESINDRLLSFGYTLDLRGKRGGAALGELDKYMDEALLISANEVRILHGKGDGILRKLIREHLQRLPYVLKFSDEKVEFGGDGITVVKLN